VVAVKVNAKALISKTACARLHASNAFNVWLGAIVKSIGAFKDCAHPVVAVVTCWADQYRFSAQVGD